MDTSPCSFWILCCSGLASIFVWNIHVFNFKVFVLSNLWVFWRWNEAVPEKMSLQSRITAVSKVQIKNFIKTKPFRNFSQNFIANACVIFQTIHGKCRYKYALQISTKPEQFHRIESRKLREILIDISLVSKCDLLGLFLARTCDDYNLVAKVSTLKRSRVKYRKDQKCPCNTFNDNGTFSSTFSWKFIFSYPKCCNLIK